MSAETAAQIAFAAGVVLVAAGVASALSGRGSRLELFGIAGLLGLAATAGWVVVALDVDRGTAVAAGGLTVCCAAALLTLPLRAGLGRSRRIDAELDEAETALRELVERETVRRGEELERTLARARAETSSRLAEDERKLAEARRSELAQRERRLAGELGEALALVERRVEQRLTEWSGDLDRIQQGLTTRLAELAQSQREAVGEAQSRLETEMEQLKAASEDQRAILVRLREEFERAAGEAGTAARREVEVHESERRRALHEVSERLRQRERDLRDRIAAEETDAVRRIQSGFADVEKALIAIRQLTRQEALQRDVVKSANTAYQLSEEQLNQGTIDITTVLNTQRTLFQAQDQLVVVRLTRLQAIVSLFQALGGGWVLPEELVSHRGRARRAAR